MPKRRQLFVGLSPHSCMFDPSAVQVGLAVDSLTSGQVFLREFNFSPVTCQMLRTRVHPPTVSRKYLSNWKRLQIKELKKSESLINPEDEGNMFFSVTLVPTVLTELQSIVPPKTLVLNNIWRPWIRASWNVYESNQQVATTQVNLLFLVGSTCFGRCFRPSSGALDCIYSFW